MREKSTLRTGVRSPLYWSTLFGLSECPDPKPEGYVPHLASVYVICAGDSAVKIGVSRDPGNRAKQLQVAQDKVVRVFWATRLETDEAFRLEKEVHDALKRTQGRACGEWYYIAPETAVSVIQERIKTVGFWVKPDPWFGVFREEVL